MSSRENVHPALRQTPILAGLEEEDLIILTAAMARRQLAPGQVLFNQGDHGDFMAVVLEGRLAVRVRQPGQEDTHIKDLRAGETVGEMACIDPAPRSASVVAEETSQVALLDRRVLDSLNANAPELAAAVVGGVIGEMTTRLRRTDALIADLLAEMAAEEGIFAGPTPVHLSDDAGNLQPIELPHPLHLHEIPRLERLHYSDFTRLLELATPLEWPDGAELCTEGTQGDDCFVILEGDVKVTRRAPGGERVLANLQPGMMVGQMALVDDAPRSATVRACGTVKVLRVDKALFRGLVASASPLALRFQEHIAVAGIRQLRMANRRLVALGEEQFAGPHVADQHTAVGSEHLFYTQTALGEWGLSLDIEVEPEMGAAFDAEFDTGASEPADEQQDPS